MLSRRAFLSSAAALAAAGRPPNVLFFMSDQESALLPGPVELPNRRRLGGVRFRNFFCNTPQCSAARSSLLTGLEPHHTGVLTNVDGTSLGKPLSPELPVAGSVFRKAGYATGYFGKWHLGGQAQGLERFGFSQSFEGRDEDAARQAAAWIRAQRGPWLAWVSVLNPHNIYEFPRVIRETKPRPGVKPPFSSLSDLKAKPAEQQEYVDRDQGRITRAYTPEDWVRYRSFYCSLVEKADACLGTVLDAVDLGSTIAVYTSDHGDALGEHGLPFKGPFMYEELLRIPLVVAAPGLAAGDREDLAVQADLAPTLASLAGLKWPVKTDGRDLMARSVKRDAVFLEYYAKQKWVNPIRTIRTSRWKLNWYDRGNRELYDLVADPHEVNNLAPKNARVLRELEARLAAWRPPMLPSGGAD